MSATADTFRGELRLIMDSRKVWAYTVGNSKHTLLKGDDMKHFITLLALSMTLSAQAFIVYNPNPQPPQKPEAQDFSTCTWNIWLYQPEKTTPQVVKKFLSKFATIKNEYRLETGNVLMEAQFKKENYSTHAEAKAAARAVVEKMNSNKDISTVCQVHHFNPHPRVSAGN